MQQGFESQPAAPVEIAISEPPIAPVALSFDSSPEAEPAAAQGPRRRWPSRARLLTAWILDLALLSALFLANLLAASRLGGRPEDLAGVLGAAPALWASLAALLAVAWSWIFVALCGRTPGMAVTGQRLQLEQGGRPTPARALVRAVLALAFALPGMFGFVLALFDARGRTLHDKVCRCISVVD
jgi:uncharacterized RDD family membrane protein YckC